ncbi:phage GP46 family protein [Gilliamella sp. B2772]|uniref:phage GP46 family protein n=1 Tax=Gilliamella sp. B2772 TaxID=2817981 RepID=UPI00226AF401|nr:phage GP46 family protein [Gilliamella sp. B2772]MCX8659610.1 phage GP46 family protein [Gilliamella sp. B2772]
MILTVNGKNTNPTDIQNTLYRALIISLFTWRRKNTSDDSDHPYGWWGDSYPSIANDKIGSRLYLLARSKLNNQTANFAKIYIKEAVQWMINDGLASRIDVSVKRIDLTVLVATINIFKKDGINEEYRFDNLWSKING